MNTFIATSPPTAPKTPAPPRLPADPSPPKPRPPRSPLGGGTGTGDVVLAVTRVALGGIFVWAFLDKLVGLGYTTSSERSVLSGGSPTRGFLSTVSAGPLQGFFSAMAGNVLVDTLFMLSLIAIGVALVAGAGLRIAAVANVVLMLGMWAAEWPPARVAADGSSTGSTNPVLDYHVVYALVGVVLACYAVGSRLGVGRWWSTRAVVRGHRSLL
ncbi:hypothetical protein [Terracoccus luteus]|uniref:Thiosulfate dehydrogenase [quinone] large subunit n=1 Tax=Terracoccus luteus TaxID=53356 RepID=A0A839PUS1_9MICO|nr:hypothetical protein [Terracoccus luteus]MBB2986504.1 thiosulfate dehydrogenase [quinone] large subunit [Terracoccus luteus]MCP2171907.1 thiosulfate dehydrogenase [quinone] large subunit [Terracoccus luteus]